jgi:hypothetical protein
MTRCSSRKLHISPDRIHYLKFILEGYDGLALLSTIDALQGLVELHYPPEVEKDVAALIEAVNSDIIKS